MSAQSLSNEDLLQLEKVSYTLMEQLKSSFQVFDSKQIEIAIDTAYTEKGQQKPVVIFTGNPYEMYSIYNQILLRPSYVESLQVLFLQKNGKDHADNKFSEASIKPFTHLGIGPVKERFELLPDAALDWNRLIDEHILTTPYSWIEVNPKNWILYDKIVDKIAIECTSDLGFNTRVKLSRQLTSILETLPAKKPDGKMEYRSVVHRLKTTEQEYLSISKKRLTYSSKMAQRILYYDAIRHVFPQIFHSKPEEETLDLFINRQKELNLFSFIASEILVVVCQQPKNITLSPIPGSAQNEITVLWNNVYPGLEWKNQFRF